MRRACLEILKFITKLRDCRRIRILRYAYCVINLSMIEYIGEYIR